MRRMLIPRHRIPKIHAICPVCEEGNVKTRISAPFADGYWRRHQCLSCDKSFHSLTPYDGRPPVVSASQPTDRELSEYEVEVRMRWWAEQKDMGVTFEVTLITRIQAALAKQEANRDEVEKYLVSVYHALERKVRDMDNNLGKDTT